MKSNRKSGFTLVEILIVVIILGILAAIVIPQFTNASQDARNSSLSSQLQTLRSQVELYKMQHNELWPTTDGAVTSAWDWAKLTGKTTAAGAAGGNLGPYLQQIPVNPLIPDAANVTTVLSQAADPANGAAAAASAYVFSQATGKIFGVTSTYVVDTKY